MGKMKPHKTITSNPVRIHYLDGCTLAHWIMGDGSRRNDGVTLCTDDFTIHTPLWGYINALIINFDINPSIHYEKGCPRISISGRDLRKILPIIMPYTNPHFYYRIHM